MTSVKFLDRFRGKPKVVEISKPEPVRKLPDKELAETIQKPIEERLSFRKGFLFLPTAKIKESGLFLDGKDIFEPPLGGIYTAGMLKEGSGHTVYMGTSDCCSGQVYSGSILEDGFHLHALVGVDTNVQDLIPLVFRADAKPPDGVSRAPLDSCVLVVGAGCAGAGVRIVNLKAVKVTDAIPTQEYFDTHYNEVLKLGFQHVPRFRADGEKIYLDFLKNGVRVKAGMVRDPNFPKALLHPADEFFVLPDVALTVDLTQKLAELGVDIAKTLEMLRNYHRILENTNGGG